MAEFKYEIIDRIAILSKNGDWTKELNIISFNERPAKYDLRDWNHEKGRMGKGSTLTVEEISNLKTVLNALEFELS
ncbi:MAG: hypothetical protein KMY55_01510 [Dethiosulfatibacter sp.]|nr:hypothetical protein [Dethiosulfatibacter sp.]